MIRTIERALPRARTHIIAPPFLMSQTLQRCNATKADTQHPTSQAAPGTTKSIPGPNWLWLEPIYEPFRAYGRVHKKRPYMTQFISTLVIYFVGDVVAQQISRGTPQDDTTEETAAEGEDDERGWVVEWVEGRDWWRTGRALLIGGVAAIPGYKWFLWLSNSFNYSSKVLSLVTKVTVNQLLFTPVFNTYFFGMQTLLIGASFPEIIERIKHTVPTSWVNSCKIWPAVTAFSFMYIPLQFRSIFGGVVAIGWQTYLNLLNQRVAGEEEAAHARGHEEMEKEKQSARVDDPGRKAEEKCTT